MGQRISAEVLRGQRAGYGEEIVSTLSTQLTWSHFIEILPLRQPLEREYYAELCRVERWSVRTLRERIASQLYWRTAIAKQPEEAVRAEISHLRAGWQMFGVIGANNYLPLRRLYMFWQGTAWLPAL